MAGASAQTDDTTPFYVGGSVGVSKVSNVYRETTATNDDTVVSVGLLGGIDQRLGRQHLTLDGSLQNNRYSTNSDLNYRSSSLRGALNWETIGRMSGVLSAKSDRSLADFNIGSGIDPIRQKNIERNDEYQAIARLGVATRYTLETGLTHRRRDFTAEQYARFVYQQNAASVGVYATPAGNVRLGVVARHTKGKNPRYPIGLAIDPSTGEVVVISQPNDYTRDDIDFTTRWSTGGSSTLNTRISRSRTKNSLDQLRDFSGTTGSVAWDWRPTGKLQLNLQYSRDTGQESVVRAADLDRVYTSWQLGGSYALTAKIKLNVKASNNRARRTSGSGAPVADAVDDNQLYNLGVRWAISRSFSLGCQYDRVSRDSSVPQYVYNASGYGCTGQAIVY
ncbi:MULTISPECIES: outer membrane beta-barrel protein [unclassified Roseateles]|uniref:outer membrane beta-barrel protein n=1 Tax=unclassified Roseateles TaxID=2626991 RepID=UPI0007017FFD|nr:MULTISPECIES: outer membrane beta-barrel protein [unclassified Roseateles]KQW41961.1 hypothetical protein ASC81_21855 [Pelomonas sp. Root405]KRA67564.1 hypothetical protein ASD88_23440 [Pelomonas sp. Root662]